MSSHIRKASGRASLPRRTTRGPLDGDDPLSPGTSANTPAPGSTASSMPSQTRNIAEVELKAQQNLQPPAAAESMPFEAEEKDLGFLLHASIYHTVSQLEVPPPFRRPFPNVTTLLSDPATAFEQIDSLLSQCDYIGAAYIAGGLLSSGVLKPTDERFIFRVLQIRYSCLELSGNVLLAAQEAKALEDISSGFYYRGVPQVETASEDTTDKLLPQHIMPFALRLQALRLQSIGFSDPRRGVASLYDLGLECREHVASPMTFDKDRKLWGQRLEEAGINVVNALIEMGDLDCARRTLDSMKPPDPASASTWTMRKVMLCLRMGLVGEARKLVASSHPPESEQQLLDSLIAIADDRLDDAIAILSTSSSDDGSALSSLAKQNAAVALLYKGEIQKARSLMQTLVDEHHSFSTLTINLATVHDLTSDRSRELKLALANQIADDQKSKQTRSYTNADFKL